MSDYMGVAQRALERWQSQLQPEPGATIPPSESKTIPPAEVWPESLADLATERAAQTADAETARAEVWLSWAEWRATELNRLFKEHGLTGQPGRIMAAIVQHGLEKMARRRGGAQ
jgi:hypothetical protein